MPQTESEVSYFFVNKLLKRSLTDFELLKSLLIGVKSVLSKRYTMLKSFDKKKEMHVLAMLVL